MVDAGGSDKASNVISLPPASRILHPQLKKAAADAYASTAAFVISNVRLIATMRSRSKKGEAGLCCAQPCDRPGPIVTMVLPTDFQPEFDLLSRRSRVSSSAAYCIGWSRALLQGSQTIHHNSSSRKAGVTRILPTSFQENLEANRVPDTARQHMANRVPRCKLHGGRFARIRTSLVRPNSCELCFGTNTRSCRNP
jgi:hypothetical protein